MSVQVKKQFEELYAVLSANENKKVSTILPQLVELMSKKGGGQHGGKNYLVNDEGQVTHVYCYYHKKWEDIAVAEYGQKKGTATGLNTMCKEGVSAWTKAQRIKKQANEAILQEVIDGKLDPSMIAERQLQIAEEAKIVEPRSDEHGYDSVDEIEL